MGRWLVKVEPDCYGFDQLIEDKKTTWDGVSNALAVKHLRTMQVGDEILYYHTGDEKAIVGLAQVISDPVPDPENEKSVVVDIKPVRKLANPVTLAQLKADDSFAEWELIRISRLSVMPVPDTIWKKIEQLALGDLPPPKAMGKRK